MKTLSTTLLLMCCLLVSGCALFEKKQQPLYKEVPVASTPAVGSAPPAPAPVVVPAPAPLPSPKPAVSAESAAPAPAPVVMPVTPPTPPPTAAPPVVVEIAKPAAPAPAPAKDEKPSKPVVTVDMSLRGKVVAYNAVGKFVVVSFQVGRMPAIGQQFSVYRGNLKVGAIRITGPNRDEITVGDLVVGDASSGDEVRAE